MRLLHIVLGLALGAALAPAPVAAAGPGPVPVLVGGEAEEDACGSTGRVGGLRGGPDSFLAVRQGPGLGFDLSDRLHQGDRVWICDTRPGWLGVVYARDGRDCGVGSPAPAREPYAGACAWGWVSERYVRLEAG